MIYTCILCNKTFNRKSNYDAHINRKYKCNRIKDELIDTNVNINQINQNVNQVIKQVNQNAQNINQNVNQINQNNTECYKCLYCNKKYLSIQALSRHKKIHLNIQKDNVSYDELLQENKKIKETLEENKKIKEEMIALKEEMIALKQEINELKENNINCVSKSKNTKNNNSHNISNTANTRSNIASIVENNILVAKPIKDILATIVTTRLSEVEELMIKFKSQKLLTHFESQTLKNTIDF